MNSQLLPSGLFKSTQTAPTGRQKKVRMSLERGDPILAIPETSAHLAETALLKFLQRVGCEKAAGKTQ